MDRASGAPLHELPLARHLRAHGHPRAGGLGRQAALVGAEPADDEARTRAARPGGDHERWLVAPPAAPLARQHDRGRHLRGLEEHRRRARARPTEKPLMDFALNDIQQELKTQARAWLGERYPLDRDWDAPADDRWNELEELGWLDVAEADLGFVEEALLLEEMGYALYPGPYLAHVTGQTEVFGSGGTIETVDPTRPLHRLPNGAAETPRLRAALAAEAVGVAQRALDLGIVH